MTEQVYQSNELLSELINEVRTLRKTVAIFALVSYCEAPWQLTTEDISEKLRVLAGLEKREDW
ncbi:MAG: hypothetical protein ACTSYG_07250 [Candidatus Heimdallarchaeota archaeon]